MRCAHAEFKQENWKTKSMKLGKGVGNAAVSGAKRLVLYGYWCTGGSDGTGTFLML